MKWQHDLFISQQFLGKYEYFIENTDKLHEAAA